MNATVVQPTYVFEGFRLDAQHRVLSRANGEPIPLAPKVFDTLLYLVERPGQLVGKRELLTAIWPHVVVEENNLNQTISQLRRALGERPDERRFIVTEPGRGYRFVAVVSEPRPGVAETTAAEPIERPAAAIVAPQRTRRMLPAMVALGAAVIATIAGLAWYMTESRIAPLPKSVALLPFENLSPDPENAFFAAGLHGEMLSQLSKIGALSVIGESSTLRLVEAGRSMQEIAAALNVETVLHATVEYAAGRVRIRPQLIAGATGQTIWADSYDREFEDIFAIESEISAEVARALQAQFTIEEQAAVDAPATSSAAAYTAYLRARSVQSASRALALEYLDEATRLDPRFALAHAAQAELLAVSLIDQFGSEAAEPSEWSVLEERIRAAADRALRLDPDLWLARHALGRLHEQRWRWAHALAEYERAAAHTPRGVRRLGASGFSFDYPDFTDAIREQRTIVGLHPLVAQEHWVLGLAHAYSGDAAAASASFRIAVSLEPDGPLFRLWLGHALGMLGRRDEALAEFRRAEQLPRVHDTGISIANLAYAYGQNGSPQDARRLVDLLASKAPDRRHQAGNWALAHLAVGDLPAARAALETVIEKIANEEPDAGHLSLRLIRANIYADPVLEQPEVAALRARLRGR
jgi:TolB-like protein/DNA-binding winged helix-turn-helix (wHTH) protein/Tfp pilus assembly protein PilF